MKKLFRRHTLADDYRYFTRPKVRAFRKAWWLGFFYGVLFLLLGRSLAFAGVACTLPFTLTNGTLADATQVMANYNALVTCLTNAAAAGANTDITSLGGLTTPIAPSQGGTPTYISATTSSGSANAQIVTGVTPSNFTLTPGYKIIFKSGFTNTAATQFNVNGTGLTNVFRRTTDGIQALAGGEIIVNSIVEADYDGAQFQLMSNVSPFPVGTVLDTVAASADVGFLLLTPTCQSTTTFAALWAKMGSPAPSGGCAAGQFILPDGRGRVVAQIDSGGSGRITGAVNFDGTVLFNSGGGQSTTLSTGNVPSMGVKYNQVTAGAGGAVTVVNNIDSSGAITSNAAVNAGSPNSAFTNLPPVLTLNRQIKY